ncbi:MAG: hypothetical protein IIZ27_03610, partial [Solobacterium sp.]|nr:hypothetical protein [Solobacterium sp.]
DAERMIRLIAGRAHQVYTGVTILNKSAYSAGTGMGSDAFFCQKLDQAVPSYGNLPRIVYYDHRRQSQSDRRLTARRVGSET